MSQSPRFAAMMEFVYYVQVAGRAPKVCKPATHDGLVVTFLRHVANSSVCVFSSSGRLGDGIGARLGPCRRDGCAAQTEDQSPAVRTALAVLVGGHLHK